MSLDVDFLKSVIKQESGFNPNATSPVGARGLMQIMPATARQPGFGITPVDPEALYDPDVNLQFGTQYMQAMLDRYDGDREAALVAYNAGAGNADKWIRAGRDYSVLPDRKQTEGYTRNILADYSRRKGQTAERVEEEEEEEPVDAREENETGVYIEEIDDYVSPSLKKEYDTLRAELDALKKEREAAPQSGFFGKLAGGAVAAYEAAREAITGSERSTPEIEALPDVSEMPLSDSAFNILQGLSVGAGTMFAGKEETRKILQENVPGLTVREDEKGNYIYKSPIDGKEYAYKPGFRVSDIPKVAGNALLFALTGGAATGAGRIAAATATQGGVEAVQSAIGGEFNPSDVVLAGATQGAGEAIGRGITALRPGSRLAGKVDTTAPADLAADELVEKAVSGGRGGLFTGGARRIVQEEVKPDQAVIESAKRLGIDEYLLPGHVTTNQAFRELSAGVASFPTTQSRQLEATALEKLGERASKLIDDLGGTEDLSAVNRKVKEGLQATQEGLLDEAERLYEKIRDTVPAKAEAPANNVLRFIETRADDLGGRQYLSPTEKRILSYLSPKTKKTKVTTVVPPLQRALRGGSTGIVEEIEKKTYSNYALLDELRKSLTAARMKKQGVFKDAETGILKKLESELMKDQQAVVERYGALDVFKAARKVVALRKGIEKDMSALFGRQLDNSIVSKITGGVSDLAKGDIAKLSKLIKAVPEANRQEVVVSGLVSAFGTAGKKNRFGLGDYKNFYESLMKNKQAENVLFANLPKEARQALQDLYRVTNGIYRSRAEAVTTGRIQTIKEQLEGADSLIGKIYNVASRAKGLIAAEAGTSALGFPGSGTAAYIAAHLAGGKSEAVKAADDLLTSPIFIKNAKKGTTEAAQEIANSAPFKKFLKSLGARQTISDPVQFITNAFQAAKQGENE